MYLYESPPKNPGHHVALLSNNNTAFITKNMGIGQVNGALIGGKVRVCTREFQELLIIEFRYRCDQVNWPT